MEFKIDTKPAYSIITPVANVIDANLTGALRQKWEELAKTGQANLIVDLHNCLEMEQNAPDELSSLHEDCYSSGCSLIFTSVQEDVMQGFKQQGTDTFINIAPTMIEAVDIVNMEILERDLFNEES